MYKNSFKSIWCSLIIFLKREDTQKKYFSDFLVQDNNGNLTMLKIKTDYMIDDRVIAAKESYASQMGFENQMRYEMVKASEAGMGRIVSWNEIISERYK